MNLSNTDTDGNFAVSSTRWQLPPIHPSRSDSPGFPDSLTMPSANMQQRNAHFQTQRSDYPASPLRLHHGGPTSPANPTPVYILSPSRTHNTLGQAPLSHANWAASPCFPQSPGSPRFPEHLSWNHDNHQALQTFSPSPLHPSLHISARSEQILHAGRPVFADRSSAGQLNGNNTLPLSTPPPRKPFPKVTDAIRKAIGASTASPSSKKRSAPASTDDEGGESDEESLKSNRWPEDDARLLFRYLLGEGNDTIFKLLSTNKKMALEKVRTLILNLDSIKTTGARHLGMLVFRGASSPSHRSGTAQ